jgi:dTDP-4-dehydrorhamnose reductase
VKIIVLGATGMIGSAMLRQLSARSDWRVVGVVRDAARAQRIGGALFQECCSGYDLANPDQLVKLFRQTRPAVVINCAGLTKHLPSGNDPVPALTMNALLPHRLAELCDVAGARLIHISTDCVFSGNRGNYIEDDLPDAQDIYGKAKHLGEVVGDHVLTLRTSTIGHELGTRFGLLEWFLTQRQCNGYRRAVFSGLPTVEFANVVRDRVLVQPKLSGLYHVGAAPIDKDSLLRLIASCYGTETRITAADDVVIDRSLNVDRFAAATGYVAPEWPQLIKSMHDNFLSEKPRNV